MKQNLFWAAFAIALVSCSVEEKPLEPVVPDGFKVLTIQATRDGVAKTSYANEKTFSWNVGDKVSVLCNDGTSNFLQSFEATTAAATSSFSATVPENVNLGPVSSSSHKVAMFPASDSHQCENDWTLYFNIPEERDFRAASGGHASADIPMFAWGTDNNVYHFSTLTGAAKFSFTGISCSTVKFQFTVPGVKLNGSYKLYYSGIDVNDASSVRWNAANAATDEEKTVTYYGDVVNGSVSFYLPYATGGIWGYSTLTLSDAATGTVLYSNDHIGSINITKNKIAVLPTIDVRTGAVVATFHSAYNIDWSSVSASGNSDSAYPAIRLMKATADEDYLYVYLEVDPAQLSRSYDYSHYIRLYAADESGSANYWGSVRARSFGKTSWGVANGNIAFTNWTGDFSSSNLLGNPDTWYYELRISRTYENASNSAQSTKPVLGESGTVYIGIVMDDTYYMASGNPQYAHLNSPETPVGVIPSYGGAMYPVTLPARAVVSSVNENLSFTESADDIANPERGLYKMVEYEYPSSQSSWTSATTSLTDSYDANNTLTLTLFYLFSFVDSDELSDAALTHIGNVFGKVRSSGKKAIVRFAYSNVHENKFHNPQDIQQEPSLSQIQNHLSQLQPVLEANQDVIYVVQAGFIGTYGEWYYTTHFSTFELGGMEADPDDNNQVKQTYVEKRDFTVSGGAVTGYENRAAVIDALLSAVPASRQIALRSPAYKSFYTNPGAINTYSSLSGFGTDADERLAFHNDAFLYGGDDMGTYSYLSNGVARAMWQQQSAYLVCGGEAPYSPTAVSEMQGYTKANTQAEIFNYHYSYLHHDTAYHSGSSGGSSLMKYWHQQGWMSDIRKWLGYRLYLDTAAISAESLSIGSTLSVSVKLNNSGAAPIINERPMMLVLLHDGTPTVLKDNLGDPRSIASQGTQTFTADVTLGQTIVAGDQLALWLPDNAENLRSTPAYSVRLANSDVTWTNGYNIFYTF